MFVSMTPGDAADMNAWLWPPAVDPPSGASVHAHLRGTGEPDRAVAGGELPHAPSAANGFTSKRSPYQPHQPAPAVRADSAVPLIGSRPCVRRRSGWRCVRLQPWRPTWPSAARRDAPRAHGRAEATIGAVNHTLRSDAVDEVEQPLRNQVGVLGVIGAGVNDPRNKGHSVGYSGAVKNVPLVGVARVGGLERNASHRHGRTMSMTSLSGTS